MTGSTCLRVNPRFKWSLVLPRNYSVLVHNDPRNTSALHWEAVSRGKERSKEAKPLLGFKREGTNSRGMYRTETIVYRPSSPLSNGNNNGARWLLSSICLVKVKFDDSRGLVHPTSGCWFSPISMDLTLNNQQQRRRTSLLIRQSTATLSGRICPSPTTVEESVVKGWLLLRLVFRWGQPFTKFPYKRSVINPLLYQTILIYIAITPLLMSVIDFECITLFRSQPKYVAPLFFQRERVSAPCSQRSIGADLESSWANLPLSQVSLEQYYRIAVTASQGPTIRI